MIDILQYRRCIGSFRQRLSLRPRKYHNRGEKYYKKYFVNENILRKSASWVLRALIGTMMLFVMVARGGCSVGHVGQVSDALHGGPQQATLEYWQDGPHDCGVDQVHHGAEFVSFRVKSKQDTPNFISRYINGNIRQKGIRNLHLNIRSLKFKVPEVRNIIKEHAPHILGLSECELRRETVSESSLKIPGYDILLPKSWYLHGFARVVVYVKRSFKYEQISDLEDGLIQSVWLRGSFMNGKKIYFCHGYREHLSTRPLGDQQAYLGVLLSQWEAAAEYNFPTEPNEVHICLDMNIDTYMGRWMQADYRLISLSRLVQDACNTGDFAQLVTEPTRAMYNSVTNSTDISCLDHVYCNAQYKCSKPMVISCGASDHDIISYIRYSKEPSSPGRTIRKRSYKTFKTEDFIGDLEAVDWSEVIASQDLEQAVHIFTRKFQNVLNRHAPWIIFQQRKNFSPWLTKETKEFMHHRDIWKQRAKELSAASPGVATIEQQEAWQQFKYYRNKVNNRKKYDEIKFKKEKLEEVKDSPEKTWKCLPSC